MPNVFFKKGSQTNFDALQSWEAGAFYLTSDTHRLYASLDGTKAFQINPGITKVANIASLPSTNKIAAGDYGQFYYCAAENVLAIYDPSQGTTGGWVQINSYEDTVIDAREVKASATNGLVSITDVLYQSSTNKGGNTFSNDVEIEGADGLVASVTPKYASASGTGFHTDITYYTLSGTTYTKVTNPVASAINSYYVQSGYKLILTAPTYTLANNVKNGGQEGVSSADILLKSGDAEKGKITLQAGPNISLSKNASDAIVITGAESDTLASVTGAANANTGFDITVTMDSGENDTGTIDPIVKIGHRATGEADTAYKFEGGILTLPVYSKAAVDEKIKDFNAMEYKGVISISGVNGKLTSASEKNGNVYMINEEGNLRIGTNNKIVSTGGSVVDVTPGDLIVIQGTEGSNGLIPAANVEVIYIPSGNDHDTTYNFTSTTHGLTITDDQGTLQNGLRLANTDNYITLTDSTDTNGKVVTLAHKTVTITETTAAETQDREGTLNIVVPTVTFDGAGHAISKATKTYTVSDTHATITNALTATSSANTATITSTVTVDGSPKTDNITLTSSNLTVSASNDALSINMEWGSF